jgi:hypothetical protein
MIYERNSLAIKSLTTERKNGCKGGMLAWKFFIRFSTFSGRRSDKPNLTSSLPQPGNCILTPLKASRIIPSYGKMSTEVANTAAGPQEASAKAQGMRVNG